MRKRKSKKVSGKPYVLALNPRHCGCCRCDRKLYWSFIYNHIFFWLGVIALTVNCTRFCYIVKQSTKYSTLHYFLQKLDFVRRFDGSSISFNYRCPNSETKYVRTDTQIDTQTHRQTDRHLLTKNLCRISSTK